MAFKSKTFESKVSANPAVHFKSLTKRQHPDVMPHQKEMLEAYADNYQDSSDVALQLPTGSGKTLVGLLIADWRRVKNGDRSVYLCPTKQLVRQTVIQAREQYGIDVVDLSGQKSEFSPADRADYKTGSKVAVSTYSGLFNIRPFFDDADLVIVDDAHAAENYIAKMWSFEMFSGTALHAEFTEFLRSHITPQEHSRLTGHWMEVADATWVEKLPSPLVLKFQDDIVSLIDAHASSSSPNLHFAWSLLRDHIDSCHIYLGSTSILIRPVIPPTWTHAPFARPSQRIFMSATLGIGGDLERLTGRKSVARLPAPDGFQSSGVGRRFFIFPTLSLTGEETDNLRLHAQKKAGRSVVLTPSTPQADHHCRLISDNLDDFEVFTKDDIEENKAPFVNQQKAVAVLANRYDGIDFPGDECRLLCVDGLPKAMNLQERFLMSKMGASSLYNDRVQTRVLQAMGRCTRSLQDRSAVFVTGTELVDFLADDRNWRYFPPELHAELYFGVDQSKDISAEGILENFEMFIENGKDWSDADGEIRSAIGSFNQEEYPAMAELEAVVDREIIYQEAMWNKDYNSALASAREILGRLHHESLRGYRAMWHYLAGAVALRLSVSPGDPYDSAAKEHFSNAKKAAPAISWLSSLSRQINGIENSAEAGCDTETLLQVEGLEERFTSLGTVNNNKFDKRTAQIHQGMQDLTKFESALMQLGDILGLSSGNRETDAAPDPWWLGNQVGVVFEAHAEADVGSIFGAVKARQASGHPKWMKKNLSGVADMDVYPILITPCTKAKSGADPHLDEVLYWELADFLLWAQNAIGVIRELKGEFPGSGDLVWRAKAARKLESEGLTIKAILNKLPFAADTMTIVD